MLSDSVPAGPKISFPPCGPDMQSLQGCKKKVLKYQLIVRQKNFFAEIIEGKTFLHVSSICVTKMSDYHKGGQSSFVQ